MRKKRYSQFTLLVAVQKDHLLRTVGYEVAKGKGRERDGRGRERRGERRVIEERINNREADIRRDI